jgi:hypothetical protein
MGCKQTPKNNQNLKKTLYAKSHIMRKIEVKITKLLTVIQEHDIKIIINMKFQNFVISCDKSLGYLWEIISQKIPKKLEFVVLSNGKNINTPAFENLAIYELLNPKEDAFTY